MTKIREVEGPKACPRCGARMMYTEQGLEVAELEEPVKWVVTSRRCPSGCLLTVDDFPPEDRI